MDFTADRIVAAPIGAVFAALTDFDRLAAEAEARGARATRSDTLAAPGAGMAWRIDYTMRGSARRALAQVTTWQPPDGLALAAQSNMLMIAATVGLTAPGPGRTRVQVAISVGARNLPGKILLQSLRLGRGKLDARLDAALARFAAQVEGGAAQ
jgi:uncharacterized protein YndB with AHSA1/START domain